jgi:hypothetical protein
MSGSGDEEDPEYRVGRGRPPKENRFQPGRSGNPLGRPPKEGRGPRRPLEQATRDIVLEEAYRLVTINEGGKAVKMPAIQAVVRSAFVKGIKGNPQAQKNCMHNVQAIERKVSQDHAQVWAEAIVQKAGLEHERRQWLAEGRDEADLMLHPDDLEICPQTGDVRNFLALTEEAREGRRQALKMQEEKVAIIGRSLRARKLGLETQLWAYERELAEQLLETINQVLPPRLRRQVKDVLPAA